MGIMMNGRRYWPRWNIAARAFVALALVLMAFAHKPIGMSALTDIAAYALPDGTLQVICTTNADDGGTKRNPNTTGCDACRICGSVLLPAPEAAKAPAPIASVDLAVARTVTIVERAAWPPSAPPHAPPAV